VTSEKNILLLQSPELAVPVVQLAVLSDPMMAMLLQVVEVAEVALLAQVVVDLASLIHRDRRIGGHTSQVKQRNCSILLWRLWSKLNNQVTNLPKLFSDLCIPI